MKLSEFDFYLPQSQIAQEPMRPRDHSRLLVVFKGKGRFEHRRFYDLPSFLQEGDCLVLNDTRVRPARLHGVRPPGGGRVELLLLEEAEPGLWLCMGRPGKRLRPGSRLSFGDGRLKGEVEALRVQRR